MATYTEKLQLLDILSLKNNLEVFLLHKKAELSYFVNLESYDVVMSMGTRT